jgi:hypothetical protein
MKRETAIWTTVLAIGVVLLAVRFVIAGGYGKAYVRATDREFTEIERPVLDAQGAQVGTERVWVPTVIVPESGGTPTGEEPIRWTKHEIAQVRDHILAEQNDPGQSEVFLSVPRTIGVWLAAFLTLGLFSFLYRDNPLYKLSESIFIGVSAAYWMVVQFWSVIVPNLIGKLIPGTVKTWAMPGLAAEESEWVYLIPLILAVMLLWRLAPKGGWIARWPLAFFIGVFAGLRMIQFIQADFLNQIKNGIMPLLVWTGEEFDFGQTIQNIIMVLGVLACLTYFFFSIEHKGAVKHVSRVGIWILMITFGAMFGFTVMGRITLLTGRLEFIFIDWLWLIDPAGKRVLETAASMMMMIT